MVYDNAFERAKHGTRNQLQREMENIAQFAKPGTDVASKTINLSWSTIYDAVEALEYMVRPSNPKLIVGVSRGGLIPATLLSHRLGIPLCTISVSAYEGTRRTLEKPLVIENWRDRYDSDKVLIVDDILDSGDTLTAIRGQTKNALMAVLVTKQAPLYGPVKFFAQVPKEVWVRFPWEIE